MVNKEVTIVPKYEELVEVMRAKVEDLTDEQVKVRGKVESGLLPMLRAGIPLGKRTWSNPKLAAETDTWMTGQVNRQPIVCNGEVLFVGKPRHPMKAEKAPSETRQKLPQTVAECLKGDFKQVWPHTFQAKDLGGLEIVWMTDEDQEMFVPVQAKYFDLVVDRFPSTTWFAKTPLDVVQSRVKNRGLKDNVVAMIMPFALEGSLEVPGPREGWMNDKGGEVQESTREAV
jgi:hypothetical protein